MKFHIAGDYARDVGKTLRGYNVRYGVFTNKRHIPAAPKTAGYRSVLGYKARKTKQQQRKEIAAKRKKIQVKVSKMRAKARDYRLAAKTASSKTNARILRTAARQRSLRARQLNETKPKTVKASRSRVKIKDIFLDLQQRFKVDLLRAPFTTRKTYPEMRKFKAAFLKTAMKGRSMGKVEKLLTDAIRIPILKRRYGRNTPDAKERKGFDRLFFDTAQMVQSIESRIRKRKARAKKSV